MGGCALGDGSLEPRGDLQRKSESSVGMASENTRSVDGLMSLWSEAPGFRLKKEVDAGGDDWPPWLVDVAGDVIKEWEPRSAKTFKKLEKIGQGTFSNVYKARDLITGKIVALKKVRFNESDAETLHFMAREILVLKRLNHPNVMKLEGLALSRLSSSLYLIFEYMEYDLARLAANLGINFPQPEVKCYMKQLLSGLEHCHNNGVLHRDIKSSNLLIDNQGVLKIADFGLASFFNPEHPRPMTNRVVTLWYRPPELLLGATHYGAGIDLWSAGCVMAELLTGKPILQGVTEVEQLHKIFKLCGSPPDEYWMNGSALPPKGTLFLPRRVYKPCIMERFKDLPACSLPLINTLLALDPVARGTATAALNSEFFTTEPYAGEPSCLPKLPSGKEMDACLKNETRRRRGSTAKPNTTGADSRRRPRDKLIHALPAPEVSAESGTTLNWRATILDTKLQISNEKFPAPHEDGTIGKASSSYKDKYAQLVACDPSLMSPVIHQKPSSPRRNSTSMIIPVTGRKTPKRFSNRRGFITACYPSFFRKCTDSRCNE